MANDVAKFKSRAVQIQDHAIYFHEIISDLPAESRCFLFQVAINYMFNVEMYVTEYYDLMRFTDHIWTLIQNLETFSKMSEINKELIREWHQKLVSSYHPAHYIVLKPNLF